MWNLQPSFTARASSESHLGPEMVARFLLNDGQHHVRVHYSETIVSGDLAIHFIQGTTMLPDVIEDCVRLMLKANLKTLAIDGWSLRRK